MLLKKVVSKVIINKLKPLMSSVIHDSQSVFVEKRLIMDKVILVFEAFYSMHHGKINGSSYFSLKLDLSKTFK